MSNGKDPNTGRFVKGQKINKKDPDIVSIEEQGGKAFLKKFHSFMRMPLTQLQSYTHDPSRLGTLDAIIIKFAQEALKKGDVARLKVIMTTYALPTELKAVAVSEYGDLVSGKKDAEDGSPIDLSKDEKKRLAEKYLKIIDDECKEHV